MEDALGWASSVVLLATLIKQVYTQWKSGTSEGVSKWLYFGQLAASAGFVAYSWLVKNWVFVVTNSLIFVNTLVGMGITLRQKRRGGSKAKAPDEEPKAA